MTSPREVARARRERREKIVLMDDVMLAHVYESLHDERRPVLKSFPAEFARERASYAHAVAHEIQWRMAWAFATWGKK